MHCKASYASGYLVCVTPPLFVVFLPTTFSLLNLRVFSLSWLSIAHFPSSMKGDVHICKFIFDRFKFIFDIDYHL